MTVDASLTIIAGGRVTLSARGHQADDGTWISHDILEAVPHDMDLGVWLEDGHIGLRCTAWHVEGEGAGVWHLTQSVRLSREEGHALVDWLNFALRLAWGSDESAP